MLPDRLLTAARAIRRRWIVGRAFCERCVALSRALTSEDVRDARGTMLLREWLLPEQCAQFDADKWFDVIGCDTGKRYRIRYGRAANVVEMNEERRPVIGWCFVPKGPLVAGDVMLAQKIALETDEHAALSVAQPFSVQAPLHVRDSVAELIAGPATAR